MRAALRDLVNDEVALIKKRFSLVYVTCEIFVEYEIIMLYVFLQDVL